MKKKAAREDSDNRKAITLDVLIRKYGDVKLSEARHRLRLKMEERNGRGRPKLWNTELTTDIYISVLVFKKNKGWRTQKAKRAATQFWKMSLKQIETAYKVGQKRWENYPPSDKAEMWNDPEPLGPIFQAFLDGLDSIADIRNFSK